MEFRYAGSSCADRPDPGRARERRGRAGRLLGRVVGQSRTHRLWQRDGAQLCLLAVSKRSLALRTGRGAHRPLDRRLCLDRLGVFKEDDRRALVLRVFWRSVVADLESCASLTWSMQLHCRHEGLAVDVLVGAGRSVDLPIETAFFADILLDAGSHGVWGLDDYHFLPFLFGSAQLVGHKHLRPKCIHDPDIVDAFAKDYMYLACIQFINSVRPYLLLVDSVSSDF